MYNPWEIFSKQNEKREKKEITACIYIYINKKVKK